MVLPAVNADDWREDLRHLADGLRREHRNVFHTVSADTFDDAFRSLEDRLPSLLAHEVIVEFARLVAMVGDGHTVLRLDDVPGFRRSAIVIDRFRDGLFVRSISDQHAAAAGARLIAIDQTRAEDAIARIRPLISRDNEMGVLANGPPLLGIPEVLHATGIIADPHRASFSIETREGMHDTITLQPEQSIPPDLIDARDAAGDPVPHWLRQNGANWFELLDDNRTLYVAHHWVGDGEHESLASFFDRVFDVVEQKEVERLILDIRRNGGGNNTLNLPLIHHLVRCDRINQWGRFFTIIGRQTFSAAMNLAVDLERHTRVIFVGEPTGSSPNHYGENGSIELPNSGLHISVSKLWWQSSLPYDDRSWITPEIPAPLGSIDYSANRDPAMDAALNYRAGSIMNLEYPARIYSHLGRGDMRVIGSGFP